MSEGGSYVHSSLGGGREADFDLVAGNRKDDGCDVDCRSSCSSVLTGGRAFDFTAVGRKDDGCAVEGSSSLTPDRRGRGVCDRPLVSDGVSMRPGGGTTG